MFDPLALADVAIQIDGRHVGLAVALQIRRHVHPRAQPPVLPAKPTGIDYIWLIERRREQDLQKRIDYRHRSEKDQVHDDDENDSKEMLG